MSDTACMMGAKYLWHVPVADTQEVLALAARYNLSLPIAQTLMTRGLCAHSDIESYLFSSLEKDVPDPKLMKDAHKAVERIIRALAAREKILICGDYDVDGVTSSALMLACLLPLGANVNFFLPNRTRDGYGLSSTIIRRAAQNGYTLVITVDNGITAFEPANVAREVGIDLIITDHHRQHDHLPDAYAIVNPNQHACSYPFKALAGVGVSFKLMSLLYQIRGLPLPTKIYELLLLGTIADVVPLVGENRFWVRHGLQQVNRIESLALNVLKGNGNITRPKISSLDIGFSITPQINALGRLEDARQAVKFLLGDDRSVIEQVGKVLLELNNARKIIERSIFSAIEQEIKQGIINIENERIIMAASSAWPPGVIGLVASRLVSAFARPTLLFHLTDDGLAKGSCRSIPAFNMFDALHESSILLKQFGGHPMAAGLSLEAKRLPELKERLERRASQCLTSGDLQRTLAIDALLLLPDATKKLLADMEYLEPFGHANAQPVFYIQDVVLVDAPVLLKDTHVKCRVFADGVIKPVIFFNSPEVYQLLQEQGNKPFTLAAHVMENCWQGRVSVELNGLDIVRSNA